MGAHDATTCGKVRLMHVTGEFRVSSFTPSALNPSPIDVPTGLPTSVATMETHYQGQVTGRSATIFTSAFDHQRGVGTYVAMESFDGSLDGVTGTFNFVHGATTSGSDRTDEHFLIVPFSGTGDLASIRGSGGVAIDDDGVHRIWFDFELG